MDYIKMFRGCTVQGVFIYYFIPCPTGKLQRAFKLEVGMFVEAWDSGTQLTAALV